MSVAFRSPQVTGSWGSKMSEAESFSPFFKIEAGKFKTNMQNHLNVARSFILFRLKKSASFLLLPNKLNLQNDTELTSKTEWGFFLGGGDLQKHIFFDSFLWLGISRDEGPGCSPSSLLRSVFLFLICSSSSASFNSSSRFFRRCASVVLTSVRSMSGRSSDSSFFQDPSFWFDSSLTNSVSLVQLVSGPGGRRQAGEDLLGWVWLTVRLIAEFSSWYLVRIGHLHR